MVSMVLMVLMDYKDLLAQWVHLGVMEMVFQALKVHLERLEKMV
jgi:hypothetical protein